MLESLSLFHQDFFQRIQHEVNLEENPTSTESVFTQVVTDYLQEADEIEGCILCQHNNVGLETKLNGYFFNNEAESIDLFISHFFNTDEISLIQTADLQRDLDLCLNFLKESLRNLHLKLEEASEEFDVAYGIHSSRNKLTDARIIVLTNGLNDRSLNPPDESVGEVTVEFKVYDIKELQELVVNKTLTTTIDLSNSKVECLSIKPYETYTSYLSIIPAEELYSMYDTYGSKLLEKNVRAFLQVKGSVNSGIKKTLIEEPGNFLAYNNGISAVASEVEVFVDDGKLYFKSLKNFQIVNGGQTTASIHHARKNLGAKLDNVFIQTKITQIHEENDYDEIVNKISKYANTQNKIQMADLSTSDPFHKELHEISIRTWAPAKVGEIKSKWYYEHSRGQYLDEKSKSKSPTFLTEFPKNCMISKTDLSKFEYSWDQKPDIVSKGSQYCFVAYMSDLASQRKREGQVIVPDEKYFKQIVAKAILFKSVEKIVSAQVFKGYKANIVAYTVSLVSKISDKRLNMDKIWKDQDIDQSLKILIEKLSFLVRDAIIKNSDGENVTQYCKKRICWDEISKLDLKDSISTSLLSDNKVEMLSSRNIYNESVIEFKDKKLELMLTIDSSTWYAMSKWCKENNFLEPFERQFCFSLGRIMRSEKPDITLKQANLGSKIIIQCHNLGYVFSDNTLDVIRTF